MGQESIQDKLRRIVGNVDIPINPNMFREVAIEGVPKMNPLSREYKEWWREQRRRCLHGYKVGGKWIPGRLYFHLNFWHIERQVGKSKRKSLGLPDYRDLDGEIFPILEDCKGFSGFDENDAPIYDNEVTGFMMVGSRDFGKSVIGSSNVGYEYTFFKNNEIIVSGYEVKYTKPLLDKVRTGIDALPGSMEFADSFYPSPFSHARIKDNWSEEIRSGRRITINGSKVKVGYNSRILHRVFKDNPMACNGLRASWHVFEEIGAFNNFLASYNSSRPCWMAGAEQYGIPYMIGTGGDMDKGSVDAMRMFYKPEAFNIIGFEDTYEGTGKPIAYFVPATKAMGQFKDDFGNTNLKEAEEFLLKRREHKKQDKVSYEQELQYYPFSPKEAFLVTTGNIFPIDLIQDQVSYLISDQRITYLGQNGKLKFNSKGTVDFEPDATLSEVDYPHFDAKNLKGCVTIYEHPDKIGGKVPVGVYIGGCDPIDQDTAYTSNSLGSVFIYKRFYSVEKTHNIIVAEYTGRPDRASDFYEVVRMLSMYYGNAKILYENMIKGLKQHFEYKKCLHLLKPQPSILKDVVPDSKVQRGYGTHMTKEIKSYCIGLIRDWLLEEYDEGKCNVMKLFSMNLLKELIYYNDNGNFDRVISFALTLLHEKDLHRVKAEEQIDIEKKGRLFDSWFKKDGFVQGKLPNANEFDFKR